MNQTEKLPVWNLEALYPSSEAWESDFARVRGVAMAAAAFKGRLKESPAVLRRALEALEQYSRLVSRLYVYANCRSDENTADNTARGRVERLSALTTELSECGSYFTPECLAMPSARLREFMNSEELALYRREFEEMLREKKHVLSAKEERLLGMLSDALGTPSDCFEMLSDADMRFGSVRGPEGKSMELTHGNYRIFAECPDRAVRRAAFVRMHSTFKKYRNTFSATLGGEVRTAVAEAKIRRYPSALAAALSGDNVPESVYTGLIDAVHGNLDAMYGYMELRRRVLGLEKLDMYDLHNPLVDSCRRKYSFAEAEQLVKAALAPLGGEYLAGLNRAFTEHWIDAPERRGKRSGAYSGGCYDSYPYVLLNYNGTLDDVFTLAHELGHSMHSSYSRAGQPYPYADYRIFVAEVASTTNEMLLLEKLMAENKDDRKMRAYLLSHLADEIRGTIFRQTMFAEFELKIHRAAESGVPLTADFLSRTYADLNRLYHGPAVKPHPLIGMEWARIPHFYYGFYVYKYATGMSAAIKLSRGILSGDIRRRDAYFGFLKAGSSKDVLDIMRDAGADLRTPDTVNAAMDYFRRVVAELETLL